jgi:hypothetical protein
MLTEISVVFLSIATLTGCYSNFALTRRVQALERSQWHVATHKTRGGHYLLRLRDWWLRHSRQRAQRDRR